MTVERRELYLWAIRKRKMYLVIFSELYTRVSYYLISARVDGKKKIRFFIYSNYNIFKSYYADNFNFNKYKFTVRTRSTVYCTYSNDFNSRE